MSDSSRELEFIKQQGQLLKKARKHSKFSQEDVGKHIGISQDIISRFETGKQPVSPYKLLEFAKLYNKPITFFYMTNINTIHLEKN